MTRDFQLQRWTAYFNHGIYDTFKSFVFKYKNFEVTAVPDPSQIVAAQRHYNETDIRDEQDLLVDFHIKNTSSSNPLDEMTYNDFVFSKVPVYTPDGFIIGNKPTKVVSRMAPASGWFIEDISDKNSDKGPVYGLIYYNQFNAFFTIVGDRVYADKKTNSVSISEFLLAATGMNMKELAQFYNVIPGMRGQGYFLKEQTLRESAAVNVLSMLLPNYRSNRNAAIPHLVNTLFVNSYGRAGIEKARRFKQFQSWHRFEGMTVGKVLKGTNPDLAREGTVITREIANTLDSVDASAISECEIYNENGVKIINKLINTEETASTCDVTCNLSAKELLYAVYNYYLFTIAGIGKVDDKCDEAHVIVQPVDKIMESCLNQIWYNITVSMTRLISEASESNSLNMLINVLKDKATLENCLYNSKTKAPISFLGAAKASAIDRTSETTNTVTEWAQSFRISKIPNPIYANVHASDCGRIDPNNTPESQNVGLIVSLCLGSKVDKYGFIAVPMYKVDRANGVIDKSKKVYLNYPDEENHIIAPYDIAWDSLSPDDIVPNCQLNGENVSVAKSSIEYVRISAYSNSSPSINTAPLANMDGPKRQPMISKEVEQAAPVLKPERMLVNTGIERFNPGVRRVKDIVEEYFESIGKRDVEIPDDISIELTRLSTTSAVRAHFKLHPSIDGVSTIEIALPGMNQSIQHTMNRNHLKPKESKIYSNNEVVFYSGDTDLHSLEVIDTAGKDAEQTSDYGIALGQNVKVMYRTYGGYGYEDSIQVNKRFVEQQMGLNMVTAVEIKKDNKDPDTRKKSNDIEFTNMCSDIPEETAHLDAQGMPKIGTYLYAGDIAIGCRVPAKKDGELYHSAYKYTPVRVGPKEEGIVLDASTITIDRDAGIVMRKVTIFNILAVEPGDKLTGLHGNKSVVSRVIPDTEMPYFEDGTTPDIILNPLGCIARENVGQLAEALQGAICDHLNKACTIEPYTTVDTTKVIQHAENLGIEPKTIYNPYTGEPYPTKCFMGTMYMVRNVKVMNSMFKAVGDVGGSINQATLQPTAKSNGGAQRISEQATWSYTALGAETVMNSLLTAHSDDAISRNGIKRMAKKNPFGTYDRSHLKNINGDRIEAFYRFLGVNLVSKNGQTYVEPVSDMNIKNLASQEIICNDNATGDPLNSASVFQTSTTHTDSAIDQLKDVYGYIDINREVIMPLLFMSAAVSNLFIIVKVSRNKSNGSEECTLKWMNPTTDTKLIVNSGAYVGIIGPGCDEEGITLSDKSNLGSGHLDNPSGLIVLIDPSIIRPGTTRRGRANEVMEQKLFQLEKQFDTTFVHNPEDFFRLLDINDTECPTYNLTKAKAIVDEYADSCRVAATSGTQTTLTNEDGTTVTVKGAAKSGKVLLDISRDLAKCGNFFKFYKEYGYDPDHPDHANMRWLLTRYVLIPSPVWRPTDGQGKTVEELGRACRFLQKSIAQKEHFYTKVLCSFIENDGKNKKNDNKTVYQRIQQHNDQESNASGRSIQRDTNLAKRVAYSSRSVICVDPALRMGQAGIPIRILETIFEIPLMSSILNNDTEYTVEIDGKNVTIPNHIYQTLGVITAESHDTENVRGRLRKILQGIAADDREVLVKHLICTNGVDRLARGRMQRDAINREFNACKEELILRLRKLAKNHPVILTRDPILHKFSIAGFEFIPVDGFAIHLHPLACKGFNADFDGDQMAATFPQETSAIEQVGRKVMFGLNIITNRNGDSMIQYQQDMLLGVFVATKYNPDEIDSVGVELTEQNPISYLKAVINVTPDDEFVGKFKYQREYLREYYDRVDMRLSNFSDTVVAIYKGREYKTTLGRLMFNSLWPDEEVFTSEQGADGFYKLKFNEPVTKGILEKNVTALVWKCKRAEAEEEDTSLFKNVKDIDGNLLQYLNKMEDSNLYKNVTGINGKLLKFLDRVKDFGFYSVDAVGTTISSWDFGNILNNDIKEYLEDKKTEGLQHANEIATYEELGFITKQVNKDITVGVWKDVIADMRSKLDDKLKKSADPKLSSDATNLFDIIKSGARGSVDNLVHICGMVGVVKNLDDEDLRTPILNSYLSGISAIEAQQNAIQGRKNLINTQKSAPTTGEQTRTLVYITESEKIGNTFKPCDTESTSIPLQYEFNDKAFTKAMHMQDVPSFRLVRNSTQLTGEDLEKWNAFCESCVKFDKTKDIEAKLTFSERNKNELLLRCITKVPMLDSRDTETIVPIEYTMLLQSRNTLFYRTVDLNSVPESIRDEVRDACIHEVDEDAGKYEWYVFDNKAIDILEKNNVRAVSIYTLFNCTCESGICPRCFGLTYDSGRVPEIERDRSHDGVHYGAEVATSIGEMALQATMDIHKSGGAEGLKNKVASDNVKWILNKPLSVNSGLADLRPLDQKIKLLVKCCPFIKDHDGHLEPTYSSVALEPGVVKLRHIKLPEDDGYRRRQRDYLLIQCGGAVEVTSIDGLKLNVYDGQKVEAGYPFTKDPIIEEMLTPTIPGARTKTLVTLWRIAWNIYNKKNSVTHGARNLETVLKSLGDYGTCLESMTVNGKEYVQGSLYKAKELERDGVPHIDRILSDAEYFEKAPSFLAGCAKENLRKTLSTALVNKTINNPNSSIGNLMQGVVLRNNKTAEECENELGVLHSSQSNSVYDIRSEYNEATQASAPKPVTEYTAAPSPLEMLAAMHKARDTSPVESPKPVETSKTAEVDEQREKRRKLEEEAMQEKKRQLLENKRRKEQEELDRLVSDESNKSNDVDAKDTDDEDNSTSFFS